MSTRITVYSIVKSDPHAAMLLMDTLLDRLLLLKGKMLVCLRGAAIKERWSSGDKMADQGLSRWAEAK